MQEPAITWAATFNLDDVSSWYEPGHVVEQCCEEGWLPLPAGGYTRCLRCVQEEGNSDDRTN